MFDFDILLIFIIIKFVFKLMVIVSRQGVGVEKSFKFGVEGSSVQGRNKRNKEASILKLEVFTMNIKICGSEL